jgi:hypothetical protein
MHQSIRFLCTLILILIASSGSTLATESLAPRITAQGFDISSVREGILGNFGEIRVRFEVPERIEELHVKERSYNVDLGKTPEMSHFPLFGLKTQVRQLGDVTLNFENYINEKLESIGDYTIELTVTDRKGKSTSASLRVRVSEASVSGEHDVNESLASDSFKLVRIGSSSVTGADDFGITWRTIGTDQVLIELSTLANEAGRLIKLNPKDYDQIMTIKQLDNMASSRENISALHLPMADNKAAGAVFGVVNQKGAFLLKVTRSYTSISSSGTTVTLVGEYRH